MSQNRLAVVPTVSVLAVMKSRLQGAVRGHSLLKKKADALTVRCGSPPSLEPEICGWLGSWETERCAAQLRGARQGCAAAALSQQCGAWLHLRLAAAGIWTDGRLGASRLTHGAGAGSARS